MRITEIFDMLNPNNLKCHDCGSLFEVEQVCDIFWTAGHGAEHVDLE